MRVRRDRSPPTQILYNWYTKTITGKREWDPVDENIINDDEPSEVPSVRRDKNIEAVKKCLSSHKAGLKIDDRHLRIAALFRFHAKIDFRGLSSE